MLRLEFDSIARLITDEDTGQVIFRLINIFQYREICEILLSPSQLTRHIGLSFDGIYRVSEKKVLKAKEYMEDNIWNKKQ